MRSIRASIRVGGVASLVLLGTAGAGCGRDPVPKSVPPSAAEPSATASNDNPVAALADAPTAAPASPTTLPATPPPGTDQLSTVPTAVAGRIALSKVVGGLKRPVAIIPAPSPSHQTKLFIVEQPGRILVLENGKLSAQAFFDIVGNVSTGNEQGLLGLAFHPKFAENRRLYVNYTDPDKDTHVVEYQTTADGSRVDPSTARAILVVDQPYSNHNGGHLEFGPDGNLYVGLGDGGSAGDPRGAGQDLRQRLGKMLRVNVDVQPPKVEISAYGLRNPWRYAFDAATGDLYIGDVGQNKWESVFVVAAGDRLVHNFGWNKTEGRHCFLKSDCDQRNLTAPVADYSHDHGCSITGGRVYRGKALPELDGVYFYGDYCTSIVRSFRWFRAPSERAGGVIREHWDWQKALDPNGQLSQISSFGTDADGELYIVLLTGSIYKFTRRGT